MCCNGSGFHEAASSVNRKCHCCMAFLLLRLHISCFCTRLGGGAGRAGSARRQGNLDGRSRFVRFEYFRGEGAGHTRLLHFAQKSWLFGFAFRCFEAPPNRWNHSCCGWRKSAVLALVCRQLLHGRTRQAFLRSTRIARRLRWQSVIAVSFYNAFLTRLRSWQLCLLRQVCHLHSFSRGKHLCRWDRFQSHLKCW